MWRKGKFRIAEFRGPGMYVDGYMSEDGLWGAHKSPYRWSLTHIPSGLKAASRGKLADVKALAYQLNALDIDFDGPRIRFNTITARDAMRAVCLGG